SYHRSTRFGSRADEDPESPERTSYPHTWYVSVCAQSVQRQQLTGIQYDMLGLGRLTDQDTKVGEKLPVQRVNTRQIFLRDGEQVVRVRAGRSLLEPFTGDTRPERRQFAPLDSIGAGVDDIRLCQV